MSSAFFNFFQILFQCVPSAFRLSDFFVSLGESFYIISYTAPLVKSFFCFWITAQRDSNSCRILVTGCTNSLALSDLYNYSTLFYTSFTLKYLHLIYYICLYLYTSLLYLPFAIYIVYPPQNRIYILHTLYPLPDIRSPLSSLYYMISSHSYNCQIPIHVVLSFSFHYMYLSPPKKRAFVYIDQSIC